jgi:hypothetical protein
MERSRIRETKAGRILIDVIGYITAEPLLKKPSRQPKRLKTLCFCLKIGRAHV